MSEAARRTYFHFTPTTVPPPGAWQSEPPKRAGNYWVTYASGDENSPRFAIVSFEPGETCARCAGWELAEDSSSTAIALPRIRAWWSQPLSPPAPPTNDPVS